MQKRAYQVTRDLKSGAFYEAVGRALSKCLRHPRNLNVAEDGFAFLSQVLQWTRKNCRSDQKEGISEEDLLHVVAIDDKGRFQILEQYGVPQKIRAVTGHSIKLNPFRIYHKLSVAKVPVVLYHATSARWTPAISRNGLKAGRDTHSESGRYYVYLQTPVPQYGDEGVPLGRRRIFTIEARRYAWEAGHQFFLSANNAYLVTEVPREYIMRCYDAIDNVEIDMIEEAAAYEGDPASDMEGRGRSQQGQVRIPAALEGPLADAVCVRPPARRGAGPRLHCPVLHRRRRISLRRGDAPPLAVLEPGGARPISQPAPQAACLPRPGADEAGLGSV